MHQYRQALRAARRRHRREVARSKLMGRGRSPGFGRWRRTRVIEAGAVPPDDEALATVLGEARRARSTVSSVELYRALVQLRCDAGVRGGAIHAALCREHGYRGSYLGRAHAGVDARGWRPR